MTKAPSYHAYSQDTGEYVGSGFARQSDLAEDGWLRPGHTTLIAPPPTGPRMAAIFDTAAETWSVHPDYRGEIWFDPETHAGVQIEGIGDPAERGLVPDAPPKPRAGFDMVFRNGEWVFEPDHRGEVWYDEKGQSVEIAEVGDPSAMGLTATAPDLRSAAERLVSAKREARDILSLTLSRATGPMLDGYSYAEVLSWPAKEREAAALAAAAGTPIATIAPSIRKEVLDELGPIDEVDLIDAVTSKAGKVLRNAGRLRHAAAAVAGLRARFGRVIDAADTPDALRDLPRRLQLALQDALIETKE